MRAKSPDWYKSIWTMDIKNMSWVEQTAVETDFIIKTCHLKGNERVLDLACGFGRHALELAKRGFEVVGVDITEDYVKDAKKSARQMKLDNVEFICCDIREVSFVNEFDLALNIADGAIGYLENDEENLKIFDVIVKALRKSGQHICDIISGDYADLHFPMKTWSAGQGALSLSEFEWDREKRIMLYGGQDFEYGKPVLVPNIAEGDPTRVYTLKEIKDIMRERNMEVLGAYADCSGKPASPYEFQMLIHSRRME